MSRDVRRRVREAEHALGGRGDVCKCGRVRVSLLADGWRGGIDDEREAPATCPVCGLPVPVVQVLFDEVAEWRVVV